MKKALMKKAVKKKGYTAEDLRDVSGNPKWTRNDFAKAKPFGELFPKMRINR